MYFIVVRPQSFGKQEFAVYGYKLTKPALHLELITDYIAEDNVEAAVTQAIRLQKRCAELSEHPGAGRKREHIGKNVRSATEGNYAIFYRTVGPDNIEILRIFHATITKDMVHRQYLKSIAFPRLNSARAQDCIPLGSKLIRHSHFIATLGMPAFPSLCQITSVAQKDRLRQSGPDNAVYVAFPEKLTAQNFSGSQ